ncbi:MAG: alpha/beta fold hydrolase [Bacteroidota bacterium]
MKLFFSVICLILVISVHASSRSVQRFSSIGDLALESGDTLYDCSVGYRTFGILNADRSNAILYCTWYMGKSADLEGSLGPGGYPDTTKYFVIAVDALCDGVSSSPSNSRRQPGEMFPGITIHDMVESQYRMVKKEFGIIQLYGIVGGSMGGMQVFEWLVSYPTFMKKAAATVGTPQLTVYNKQGLTILRTIIEYGRKYSISELDQSALYSMSFAMLLRTPEFINKNNSQEKLDSYLNSFRKDSIRSERFLDLRYQLDAMLKHNIYRNENNDIAATVKKIKAKILLIVATKDLTVNSDPAVQFANAAKASIIELTNDCGHLAPGCEQKRTSEAMLSFFNN